MADLGTAVGWLTVQKAIGDWPDAPGEPNDGYQELVDLLQDSWEALAPRAVPVPDGVAVPSRYARAQLLYAQHLWARAKAGNGDTIGADGFQVSTYPLVLEAYSLLRVGRTPFRGLR